MALRQAVWIDKDVQGLLVGRVVIYWACTLLYIGLGTACIQYYQNPEWTLPKHATLLFSQMWPWLPSVFCCLPLLIFDVVRLSNAFVGPVYRLRKHLAELNKDPNCLPLNFRTEDYWQDLVEPVHCLQAEMLALRTELTELRRDKAEQTKERELFAPSGERRSLPPMGIAETEKIV